MTWKQLLRWLWAEPSERWWGYVLIPLGILAMLKAHERWGWMAALAVFLTFLVLRGSLYHFLRARGK